MATSAKHTIWTRNFICILLANCLLQMSHSSTNTLVSTYATFLGAGPKLMGLLTGMFYGIALAMRPVAGPVQTRVDHRKLILGVFALGCVVNAGYALFHSVTAFMLFRVLHGVQYAFVGSLCMTIAADSLPQEKLASGLGVFGASSAVAQAIAPQIGISLRAWGTERGGEDFGYTAMFVFAAAMLVCALIPAFSLRSTRRERGAAAVGKWYKNIISRHAAAPALIMMLMLMSFSIFSSYMVPFGTELGMESQRVGLFFTVFAGAMLAIRPLSGWLSDRLGLRRLLIPGVILFFGAFLIVGSAVSLPLILAGALVAALGYGTANPVTQALTMQTEPRARRAVASNTLYVGMDIGLFMGPLLGGFVRDFAGSYKAVILGGCVPPALALIIFLIAWPGCARRITAVQEMEQAAESEA